MKITGAAEFNQGELRKTYDRIATWYARDRELDRWGYEVLEETLFPVASGGLVLDAGCGPGYECAYLYTQGYRVTGIDISGEMLKQARRRAPGASFFANNVLSLTFADHSFDAFIARAVLLHIPKRSVLRALRELARVLIPGGVGYIAIKQGSGEKIIEDVYGTDSFARFFSFFEKEEFVSFCADAGLRVLKILQEPAMDKDMIQYIVQKR